MSKIMYRAEAPKKANGQWETTEEVAVTEAELQRAVKNKKTGRKKTSIGSSAYMIICLFVFVSMNCSMLSLLES